MSDENISLYESKERWYGHVAALSFIVFVLIVGVPIWWHTTTVYRAYLPYNEIKNQFHHKPLVKLELQVVVAVADADAVKMAEFGESLQEAFKGMSSQKRYIALQYHGSIRQASAEEFSALAKPSITDLETLELPSPPGPEEYQFYILDSKTASKFRLPYINSGRRVFLSSRSGKLADMVPQLVNVCQELFRPEDLSTIYQQVHGSPLKEKQESSSQPLQVHSDYSVVFSLLVPQPHVIHASWDVQSGLNEYMSHFQKTIGDYINIKMKSQVLYYEGLQVKPLKSDSGYNYLPKEKLPHIINPIESRLGSFADTDAILNFIVYIPTDKEYPLHIHDGKGEKVAGNAFVVARWGGFMVYNCEPGQGENSTGPVNHQVDMEQVLRVFLPQLKSHLGFSSLSASVMNTKRVVDSSLSQWELDQWVRKRAIECVATATHSLYSLSNLLQQIRNMVINDDISQQVKVSTEAISETYQLLSKGSTSLAYGAALKAYKSSEKAFFDPSLLELLYFPSDQKFAIYIPLFAPIGLPMVISGVIAVKWFLRKRTESKPKTD